MNALRIRILTASPEWFDSLVDNDTPRYSLRATLSKMSSSSGNKSNDQGKSSTHETGVRLGAMASASPPTEDVENGTHESHIMNASLQDVHGKAADELVPGKPLSSIGKLAFYINRFEQYLIRYNLEARGLQRVEPQETHDLTWKSYLQAFLLWVSMNLAANNITLGMLAPAVFTLGFRDAALCAVFGSILGSLPVAYISYWGPISGNRTMIFARYTFGWWPSKLIVVLNIVVLLGYSLIDLVIAGQILSAVSTNGNLNVVVGIIIVAVICWVISTFGISLFHTYQRYAWFPQLIAVSILYGVSSSEFDLSTPSQGDSRTRIGNRLSFFSLCLSAAITYAGIGADFFVYYPPSTSRSRLFTATLLGLVVSFTFALIVGIGLASAVSVNEAYAAAYETSQGALILEGFSSLGGFGKFLAVVILLSLVANTIGPSYSIGIDFQILARVAQRVPRFIWNTCGVIVYTVCALAGRNSLAEIFTNFLALMGYWVSIWIAITFEEQMIFRRRKGYDWAVWNQQDRLPVGAAALVSFLVGWAGAILCMAQVWYIGPIAKEVGEHGADVSYTDGVTDFRLHELTIGTDGDLCWLLLGCLGLSTSPMDRAQKIETMTRA
ncbi:MAG: hypothetical protein Q9217_006624 [Psora testacea]